MAFRVGQKVVCVDVGRRHLPNQTVANWLSLDVIYEIRWIGPCPYPGWDDGIPCVRLVGIDRGECDGRPEWYDFPFCTTRFRPVIEKSTDVGMAIFREILDRETVKDGKPVKV